MKKYLRKISRRDWAMLLSGFVIALVGFGIVHYMHDHRAALPYQAKGIDSPWIPLTVKYWKDPVNEQAKKYNLDPNFVAIIMTMESGGYAKAKSEVGALGLMQVTPATAKEIAAKHLKKPVKSYNLADPKTNIEFGTAYLAYLRKTFQLPEQGPSWDITAEQVAGSYNAGPIAGLHLQQGKGIHDTQALIYSRDAFNMWRERHAKSSPTFDRWKERGGQRLIDKAKEAHQ
jgi:soluble lytic murein transglycosylase-like protein